MKSVAMITGAGRGIGRATAVALATLGYACVLTARSREQLDETAELCKKAGGADTLVLPGDVADATARSTAVEAMLGQFGRIDVLINNAGHAPLVPFDQIESADIETTLAVNLAATIALSRLVYPTMLKQKSGVIVNISSEAARDPYPGFAVYAAAKAGVNAFTLALSKEAAAHGVRVHAVAPAGVETAMLRGIISKEQYGEDKTLRPTDVAGVIIACVRGELWCASGETIYVHQRAG